jgi:hypothetical protein
MGFKNWTERGGGGGPAMFFSHMKNCVAANGFAVFQNN